MEQARFERLKPGDQVRWYDDRERVWIEREVMSGWRPLPGIYPLGKVILAPTNDYGSQDVTSPDELDFLFGDDDGRADEEEGDEEEAEPR